MAAHLGIVDEEEINQMSYIFLRMCFGNWGID